MHELSLCQQLLSMVKAELSTAELANVEAVLVSSGKLACVDAESLQFAFDALKHEAGLAEATMRLRLVEGYGHCEHCGLEQTISHRLMPCQQCEHWPVIVSRGDDVLLDEIVLKESNPPVSL